MVPSQFGLLTTVAYKFLLELPRYALEGSIAITGALVQWLRDNLGLITKSAISSLWRRPSRTMAVSILCPRFRDSTLRIGKNRREV